MASDGAPLTPPSTPRRRARPPATPKTPNEVRTRRLLHTQTSLTISSFTSLLVQLHTVEHDSLHIAHSRQALLEQYREDFLIGALMYTAPPPLRSHDSYSSGGRLSLSQFTNTTATSLPLSALPPSPRMPLSNIERGLLAEQTIKAALKRDKALLEHKNLTSLAKVVRRAMARVRRPGAPKCTFVAPGLLHSPNFVQEYEDAGYAKPGLRWGNFKPDLLRFERKGKDGDQVTWEVIEIKYSNDTRGIIFNNYKIQAVFYHLALAKLLSRIPHLTPSHKVSLWLSSDPLSATAYTEKPIALRTQVAFVEHHLFQLLPEWLGAVTCEEWDAYQERRAGQGAVQQSQATPVILDSPSIAFLERIDSTPTRTKPPTRLQHPRLVSLPQTHTTHSTQLTKKGEKAAISPSKPSPLVPYPSSKPRLDHRGDSDESLVTTWLANLPPLPYDEGDDDDLDLELMDALANMVL